MNRLAEEALAGQEHDRIYGQPQFVDEVVLHQGVYEMGAGIDDDREDLSNYTRVDR